ncbi:MAG: VCBS repeat-containing protein, partial [Planctomycetes bacterium]|nr:VCBS repeat-containing protein [Planctomycetota bacterium]
LAANNARFSLAASWFDYDGDGDSDLYVANDFGPNGLYRNDGGRFVEVAAQAGAEDQAAGMGVTFADFDLDGDVDLYVSNMFSSAGQRIAFQPRFMSDRAPSDLLGVRRHALGNTLLANRGDGTFEDVSDRTGVRMGRWAWGAMFVDLNNDAYDDLVVPNGFLTNRVKDDL